MQEKKKKVLVVDDDESYRALLSKVLTRQYEVDTARDGQEALDRLPGDYFALFTDLNMPGLTGVDLIVRARKKRSYNQPAFLMSDSDVEKQEPGRLDPYLARHGLTREQFFSPAYCNGFVYKEFIMTKPLELLRALPQ